MEFVLRPARCCCCMIRGQWTRSERMNGVAWRESFIKRGRRGELMMIWARLVSGRRRRAAEVMPDSALPCILGTTCLRD